MERIVIIGCPGSGKSTLARALGEKLNLTVVHLDRLWWTKDQQHTSREEFDARLENALKLDCWIIDGNYSRTMDTRLQRCDTIIYLDFSRWSCLWGVLQRATFRKRDIAAGNPKRLDWEFVKYIWNFNKNNRVLNATRIAKNKHAKAIVLKNRKEVKQFLEKLQDT
jgi:adenylate kinase family enzyme